MIHTILRLRQRYMGLTDKEYNILKAFLLLWNSFWDWPQTETNRPKQKLFSFQLLSNKGFDFLSNQTNLPETRKWTRRLIVEILNNVYKS